MIIEISTEVDRWQSDDPSDEYNRGEPYAYRGAEDGTVTNVTAAIASDQSRIPSDYNAVFDLNVQAGHTVYALVATYTTGDTFGSDGGQTQVVDVFTDPNKASELSVIAKDVQSHNFEMDGKEYRASWVGYFEHLDNLTVWEVTVKNFHDYDRFGGASSTAFRRGH